MTPRTCSAKKDILVYQAFEGVEEILSMTNRAQKLKLFIKKTRSAPAYDPDFLCSAFLALWLISGNFFQIFPLIEIAPSPLGNW